MQKSIVSAGLQCRNCCRAFGRTWGPAERRLLPTSPRYAVPLMPCRRPWTVTTQKPLRLPTSYSAVSCSNPVGGSHTCPARRTYRDSPESPPRPGPDPGPHHNGRRENRRAIVHAITERNEARAGFASRRIVDVAGAEIWGPTSGPGQTA